MPNPTAPQSAIKNPKSEITNQKSIIRFYSFFSEERIPSIPQSLVAQSLITTSPCEKSVPKIKNQQSQNKNPKSAFVFLPYSFPLRVLRALGGENLFPFHADNPFNPLPQYIIGAPMPISNHKSAITNLKFLIL